MLRHVLAFVLALAAAAPATAAPAATGDPAYVQCNALRGAFRGYLTGRIAYCYALRQMEAGKLQPCLDEVETMAERTLSSLDDDCAPFDHQAEIRLVFQQAMQTNLAVINSGLAGPHLCGGMAGVCGGRCRTAVVTCGRNPDTGACACGSW